MSILRHPIWVLVIVFVVSLILFLTSPLIAYELILLFLPLSLLLLVWLGIAARRILKREVLSGIRMFSAAMGLILALLVWGEWTLDWFGSRIRHQAILGLHIYQHHDRTQAAELWRRVRELVGQSHVRDSSQREEAWVALTFAVSATKDGWVLEAIAEKQDPDEKPDMVWVKEDAQFARGARVLSLLEIDHREQPESMVAWFQAASWQVDPWRTATKSQLATLTYAFRKPQDNRWMAIAISQLQTQLGNSLTPIVIAWTDEGGNNHVVCIGCNDEFTLEDARNQACQQSGICAPRAQSPEDFLRENPPSQNSQTSGGGDHPMGVRLQSWLEEAAEFLSPFK